MAGPNILLLFADQHRRDALGAYGGRWVHSPCLDEMAQDGVLFERSYTNNPVCVAARYSLLTGQRCRTHGYFSNSGPPMDPAIPTIPMLLSNAAYVTQAIGKMHWKPPRRHHGFDRMLLMEETPSTREEDDYLLYLKSAGWGNVRHQHGVRHLLYHQPQRSLLPEEHQGTRWVADRSIEFLRAHRNRPWFLWAGWIAPHPPFNCAGRWAEFYKDREVPDPARSPDEKMNPRLRELEYLADIDRDNLPLIRRCRQLYAAQVSFVDEQIGRILNELDILGLRENTLVVYTSDHGELLGDHFGWQKQVAFEGSTAVPMIARFPGGPSGIRSSAFVDPLDLLPTFMRAAGVDLPEGWGGPGGALQDLLEGEDGRDRGLHFFHYGSDWRRRFVGVVGERYKLACWVRDGFEEMYDLRDDPQELRNLCVYGMDEDAGNACSALRKALVEFNRDWGPAEFAGEDLPARPSEGLSLKRNAQLPKWPDSLASNEERSRLNPLGEEIVAAVDREPLVRLSELDLDGWVRSGGPPEVAEEIRRKGL